MFGLVDRLLLRSHRAPLLSADVDNGEAVETEDECVFVCVIKVRRNREWWGGWSVCTFKKDYLTKTRCFNTHTNRRECFIYKGQRSQSASPRLFPDTSRKKNWIDKKKEKGRIRMPTDPQYQLSKKNNLKNSA